jgi:hypothetical protein
MPTPEISGETTPTGAKVISRVSKLKGFSVPDCCQRLSGARYPSIVAEESSPFTSRVAMIRDSQLYLNAIRSPTQDPERLPEINWDRLLNDYEKDVLALWWDLKLGGVARAISISVSCAGKRTNTTRSTNPISHITPCLYFS